MMKIIDLSVPTESSPSEPLPVMVTHQIHEQSVPMMEAYFGCKKEDLPQGLGWANDAVSMGAHAGTHVDAPLALFPSLRR